MLPKMAFLDQGRHLTKLYGRKITTVQVNCKKNFLTETRVVVD